MKFIKAISIVILVICTINCGADTTVDLGGDGTQDMMLNYIDNPGSALMNIEFAAHLSNALNFYQTATAICFNKQDSADDIQEGDKGFGIMFACYMQDGCNDGTRLSTWLFASHLASMTPPTWAEDGEDFSQWNIGPHDAVNGTYIDTSFILDANEMLCLTIPPPSHDTNWRCYFNFLGNEPDTRLDHKINLEYWTTATTWTQCVPDSTGTNCGNGGGTSEGTGGSSGEDTSGGSSGETSDNETSNGSSSGDSSEGSSEGDSSEGTTTNGSSAGDATGGTSGGDNSEGNSEGSTNGDTSEGSTGSDTSGETTSNDNTEGPNPGDASEGGSTSGDANEGSTSGDSNGESNNNSGDATGSDNSGDATGSDNSGAASGAAGSANDNADGGASGSTPAGGDSSGPGGAAGNDNSGGNADGPPDGNTGGRLLGIGTSP